jgi:hypothetical protein
MADASLQVAELRWQRWVLVPLWLDFVVSAVVALITQHWFVALGFVFLMWYIGTVGARLSIHHGKTFRQLAEGITPVIADTTDSTSETGDDPRWRLTGTMLRTLYAVIIAAVLVVAGLGLRWYWVFTTGVCVWFFGRPIGAIAAELAMHRRGESKRASL